MQKFDFVKNLEKISENLFSQEINKHFDSSIKEPRNDYNFEKLKPILFNSKSKYDQLIEDDGIFDILKNLNSEKIYSVENLSNLTNYFHSTQISKILLRDKCLEFYKFHLTIISTLQISKNLLLKNSYSDSNEQTLENGIIIFEIVIGEELENIQLYIKVLSLLKELTSLVDKISNINTEETDDLENEKPVDIVLLDSGSSSNIGLKTGIDTAKSLFLIFKEIWDFTLSYKQYKSTQNSNALLESLTIRKEILTKLEEGVITDKEAQEYTHIIKTRAEDLIGLKVLPKELVQENHKISNVKLLNEFKELRLLNQQ